MHNMNNLYNGVIKDTRTTEEQNKDFQHTELFGYGIVNWEEKPENTWKSFPIRNQNGSSMCGPFASKKALAGNNESEFGYKNLDARFIYNLRKDKNREGMEMVDLFNICVKYGASEDNEILSDNLTEAAANSFTYTDSLKKSALKYKAKNYFFTRKGNIDDIYTAIKSGYYPIILLRCNLTEWTSEPKVNKDFTKNDFNVNHYVVVVDATLYKGKKCVIIEDSWGSSYGKNGRRILSEDFVDQRVEACGYMVDWKEEKTTKPKFNFTKKLTFGMNNSDVKELQNILKFEGLFPQVTESTSYYGSITAKAVKELWKKHSIATQQEIDSLQGKVVGPKTILWLNNHYAG